MVIRGSAAWRLTTIAVVMVLAAVGCTVGGGADATFDADPGAGEHTAPTDGTGLTGPLCDALPAVGEPGGPDALATEPADIALTWIPVGTTFEAGVRATGLDVELNDADGVTILVPTDDAFDAAFSESTMDELLISRRDELRTLLESHLINGTYSLDELLDEGTLTTLAGDTVTVTAAGPEMVRFDDRAESVCANYRVANARIHVIGAVLGEHPPPAATEEPHVG